MSTNPGFKDLGLEGLADPAEVIEQMRRQQEEVMRIQRAVEAMEVKGASRHNDVQVTVRGNGQVTDVYIDPDALFQYNASELGDVVKDAVNDGLRRVKEASAQRFRPLVEAASQAEAASQSTAASWLKGISPTTEGI